VAISPFEKMCQGEYSQSKGKREPNDALTLVTPQRAAAQRSGGDVRCGGAVK